MTPDENNMQAKELSSDEMSNVAGGANEYQQFCPHTSVARKITYEKSPGKNDWGYHVSRIYKYTCRECGLTWVSPDQNCWLPPQ